MKHSFLKISLFLLLLISFFSIIPLAANANIIVAASDSTQANKDIANYVCNGTYDEVTINTAINSASAYEKVTLEPGTYNLYNPIAPKTNIVLEINGLLKPRPYISDLLSANADYHQKNVAVTDASKFFVGQWVAIIDDNTPIQGGGASQIRHSGDCSKITGINGNTITLAYMLTYNYTTAANAKLVSYSSEILINNVNNVSVYGTGEIDGDMGTQYDLQPMVTYSIGNTLEETNAGCGISIKSSTNISVKDIYIHESILHNTAVYSGTNVLIENTRLDSAHDKNLLVMGTNQITITGNTANNAQYEDGIILYSANNNSIVTNNTCINNNRYAFETGLTSLNTILSDNTFIRNKTGGVAVATVALLGNYTTSTNDYISGTAATTYVLSINGAYITLNNITIRDNTQGAGALIISGYNTTVICGNIEPVKTNAGTDHGIAFAGQSGKYPKNTYIESVHIHNSKTGVKADNGITNVTMNYCVFYDNTVDIVNNSNGQLFVLNMITAPAANFSANSFSGIKPLTISFDDLSTGTIDSYQWNFGDGSANSTLQNPAHTYSVPGTYTVSLTVINDGGSSTLTKTGLITVKSVVTDTKTSFVGEMTDIIAVIVVLIIVILLAFAYMLMRSFQNGGERGANISGLPMLAMEIIIALSALMLGLYFIGMIIGLV